MSWFRRQESLQYKNEPESNSKLEESIRVAKTAQTIMLDRISEWAGAYEQEAFENMLPIVWERFVNIVKYGEEPQDEPEVALVEEAAEDDTLAPEDMEPEVVVSRPEIPPDAPQSEVVPPDQLSLGDVLAKIENSKD